MIVMAPAYVTPPNVPYWALPTPKGCAMVLPWPPPLNNLYVNAGRRRVLSDRGKAYHETVALLCGKLRPAKGEVAVRVHAFRPRKRADIDGITKAVFDGLTGFAWDDDGQIVDLHITRHDDKANPRVEVVVTAAGGVRAAGGVKC